MKRTRGVKVQDSVVFVERKSILFYFIEKRFNCDVWAVNSVTNMLGRKQSLKGDPILSDYGPEESLENADMDLVSFTRM